MIDLWNMHWDRKPDTWAECNRILCDMIEQDETRRSPIVLGIHQGKLEERAWIKTCFEHAQGDQMERLIGQLIDGTFPKAFRDHDEIPGRVVFYEFEEDCPDGPMD